MRVLMILTLGFSLGCGLCAYLLPVDTIWILCGCALLFALILIRKGKRFRRSVVFLLGLSLGSGWFLGYHALYLSTALGMDGQTEDASLRVRDYSVQTDYGSAAEATVMVEGKKYHTKVYLKDSRELVPGDTLRGSFRFQATLPSGGKPSSYYRGRGTFLLMYQADNLSFGHTESRTWMDWTAELRKGLKDAVTACFPEDTRAFAKALLLGDTKDLGYEEDTALKISGIRHVAAVSGLHVSILFALISMVTLRKRFLTALLGLPALVVFAALAGFTPSVTRACLMWGLMLLAWVLDKNYDSPTALSFAALAMLLSNPSMITDIGFQLSLGSAAGILLFSGRIQTWVEKRLTVLQGKSRTRRLLKAIAASVSITIGAQIFTAPLCAMYFGVVSLIGVVTNLLTLWVISFIFYGVTGVCLLYGIWQGGAAVLAQGISWLIRYVQAVSRIMARIPFGAVYTRSFYIVAWLVLSYVLLAVFLAQKRKRPGVLACCAAIGLCAALLASWAEPLLDDVRFTVLNVGQGQCLLLQSQGYTFMVDCGGDQDRECADMAAEALLSQGITRMDGLILTHCDWDHSGGTEGLLSRVDTRMLILPPESESLRTGGEVIYANQDLELCFGTGKIRVYPAKYPGNSNESSLCVLFDTENCDILITGDRNGFGERSLLRHGDIPKVDILVAGHHGSKNSTCQELLTAVEPEIVCISAGENNSFGHPAPELLKRLEENGCTVYRTDLQGDILIRR